MTKILSVATAGLYADPCADVKHLRIPRVDYIELQNLMETETIDYSAYNTGYAGGVLRRLDTQLRSDIYMATLSWLKSRDHPVVFAWSERVGIPLATYKRFFQSDNRLVTMFQCWSERQELVITKLNLFSSMDKIVVHCKSMQENLIRLGAPEERVKLIRYSIDQAFFSPLVDVEQTSNLIMTIGEPRSRNYSSLFQAVDGLPVNLTVAGFGHWYAREKNVSLSAHIPANVSLTKHLLQVELRKLYASSRFVVLPIQDLVYSAGATAALEAGSMARAVIAYRSRGIADYIIDGETGILVEAGNTEALRDAIRFLLANPSEAKRLGQNARQRIIEELNLEIYVSNIADLLTQSQSAQTRSIFRVDLPVS